jgi:hypothetical protein
MPSFDPVLDPIVLDARRTDRLMEHLVKAAETDKVQRASKLSYNCSTEHEFERARATYWWKLAEELYRQLPERVKEML